MLPCDDRVKFVILAPEEGCVSGLIPKADDGAYVRYDRLIGEMQRLRGRIALNESAIADSVLDHSGRYLMPGDEKSWHLLRVREDVNKIVGCVRVLVHRELVTFPQLRIAGSSVARCPVWGPQVRKAVESDLAHARRSGTKIIEPGGWVVDEDYRGTAEALSLAVGAFAWGKIIRASIAYVTATEKNGSSAMLRRLGGHRLGTTPNRIPRYFEPAWGCNAELLRFDPYSLNPRFMSPLASVKQQLLAAAVICRANPGKRCTILSYLNPTCCIAREANSSRSTLADWVSAAAIKTRPQMGRLGGLLRHPPGPASHYLPPSANGGDRIRDQHTDAIQK